MRRTLIRSALLLLVVLQGHGALAETRPPPESTIELKEKFDDLLKKARQFRSWESNPRVVLAKNPALQEMIALGPPCLPYLMEVIHQKDVDAYMLLWVAAEMLKIAPEPVAASKSATFREWLDGKMRTGYEEAEKEFVTLREQWFETKRRTDKATLWHDVTMLDPEFKVLRTQRQLTPLGKVYTQIQDLGIFVLPRLMEELRKGEYDFLPIIRHLTKGAAHAEAGRAVDMAKTSLAWWAEHRSEWIVELSDAPLKRGR